MYIRKAVALMLAAALFSSLTGCKANMQANEDKIEQDDGDKTEEQWKRAETTPLGKYPETVNYTVAKPHDANNSNMPEGDSYNDNNYTRYLLRTLNVQNEEVFDVTNWYEYTKWLQMQISEDSTPDVMAILDRTFLEKLVEDDALEDLSEVYEKCASPRIKEMYSTDEDLLEQCTFDGKLMALPAIQVDHGISMVWLRKDWMDKLGIEEPKNWDEIYDIIERFAKENPGNHPDGNVGLTFLMGNMMSFTLDPVMESKKVCPSVWYPDENGRLVKGSVQKEMKEALELAKGLYERGVLDASFMLRQEKNIQTLIDSGQSGAVCGGWWMPTSYFRESYESQGADWMPYIFPGNDGKITSGIAREPTQYVVVRKGYEHPEIVPKIVSAMYDHARFDGKESAHEVQQYLEIGIRQPAMPLGINVDYQDSVFRTKNNIEAVWNNEIAYEDLSLLEQAVYDSCQLYREENTQDKAAWASYRARITAVEKNQEFPVEYVNKDFWRADNLVMPGNLDRLEKETFIAMITGEQPIEEFEDFVKQWYAEGGRELEDEVNKLK